MDHTEKYLLHCAGIYTMLAWIEAQTELGTGSKVTKQAIYIPPLASRYFSLGISKHKKAKFPFLCIQPNESQWIDMITWDYAVIRKNDNNLYLISSIVKGDNSEYPDIPAFALAICFDTKEKLELLNNVKKIEGREYFIDTDGTIRVNFHSKIFTIPLKNLEENEPFLVESKITNYNDIMADKEKVLQSVFTGNSPPVFKGELADIPESRSLLKKLKDKLL